MCQIKDIVEHVSGVLGPDADPAQVEAVASSLIDTKGTASIFTGGRIHVALTDCSSLLTTTVRSRVYDKIRRIASHLESAMRAADLGGARHIATSPLSQIAGKATASDVLVLAQMLDDAAQDCSASEITGLTACVERGIDPVAAALFDVIPEVLRATSRVVVEVRAATVDVGINVDAVKKTIVALRRYHGTSEDLLRLRLTRGSPASLPVADAALFLTANAAPMMNGALRTAPEAPLQDIAAVLKATAFGLGRSVAPHGEAAAATLADRSGLKVRFGGIEVDPGAGSSDDHTVQAALAAAIVAGFRAAVGDTYVLPRRIVTAFSSATSDDAAGARVVNELGRSVCKEAAVHALFSERSAGELMRVGPFHNVRVDEPAEQDWFRRGGLIPAVKSFRR